MKVFWQVEPLHKRHDREVFSCGDEELDRYLQKQASQDALRKMAATFVLPGANQTQVTGYYTLPSYGIHLEDLPEETIRKLPRRPGDPAWQTRR